MLPLNQVYCLDCIDFLSKIPNESIDLAIIDPPYNLGMADWDTFASHNDFLMFTYNWIDHLIPKLKKSASIYIFNTPFNSAFILQYLDAKGLIYHNWITWDKRDGFSANKHKFNQAQETILFFSVSKEKTFNYDAVRVPYDSESRIKHAQEKGILKNGKRWFPHPNGKLCTDIWHITSERHKQKQNGKTVKMVHITPKPLTMIERIILASSNENDVVLDCFAGSGTTAFAAQNLNRQFICCDKNQTFVDFAQQQLFKQLNPQTIEI